MPLWDITNNQKHKCKFSGGQGMRAATLYLYPVILIDAASKNLNESLSKIYGRKRLYITLRMTAKGQRT